MKVALPIYVVAILLASCTEPKMQLRAPNLNERQSNEPLDTAKADSTRVVGKI